MQFKTINILQDKISSLLVGLAAKASRLRSSTNTMITNKSLVADWVLTLNKIEVINNYVNKQNIDDDLEEEKHEKYASNLNFHDFKEDENFYSRRSNTAKGFGKKGNIFDNNKNAFSGFKNNYENEEDLIEPVSYEQNCELLRAFGGQIMMSSAKSQQQHGGGIQPNI